jgi:hypothetical protein
MSYILVTRNPRSKNLVPILADDNETIAEFDTEGDANAVAMAVPICEAWGYEAVEITALSNGQCKGGCNNT